MDYIDWIIATIVFLVTVSLILVTVFNFIPVNKETNIVSENLYKNIIENIDVYNIKTTNTEVTPYFLDLDNNIGFAQNLGSFDGNRYYGVLKNKDTLYDVNIDRDNNHGILVLEERFDDFNLENNFSINSDVNINAGILVLGTNSTVVSSKEYFDFTGFFSTTDNVTVYFNYISSNNNFFCEFTDSNINIGKIQDGDRVIQKTKEHVKTNSWSRVQFSQNLLDNKIVCGVGDVFESYNLLPGENFIKSRILIKNEYNNTLIDDFYLYLNNDIISSSTTNSIKGNYFECDIENSIASINLIDGTNNASLGFNFTNNLNVLDREGISFVKADEKDKIGFFPQSKEFWVLKDADEEIEITFDETLNVLFSGTEPENTYLWLDASSLELNDNDSVEFWEDKSGNDFNATQSLNDKKPTFKTNILNGNPVIRFNNSHYLLLPNSTSTNLDGQSGITAFLVANKTKHGQRNAFIELSVSSTLTKMALEMWTSDLFRISGRSNPSDTIQAAYTEETHTDNQYNLFSATQNLVTKNMKIWTNGKITADKNSINFSQNTFSGTGTRQTIGTNVGLQNFLKGDIAEIILYDYVLPDENRIEIEKYLAKKYNLNLEMKKYENKIELFDNAIEKNKIIFEFFDKKTDKQTNCNYIFDDASKKINITDCEEDVIIKVRYDLAGVDDFLPRNKINITKTKEEIITENKFIKITEETVEKKNNEERIYYLRLFNKVTNLENTENIYSAKPYTNFTKLLWNTGLLEEIKVEIKN